MLLRNLFKQLDSKMIINSAVEFCALPYSTPGMTLLNNLRRLSLCAMSFLYVGCASTVVIKDNNAPSAVLRVNKELRERFSINAEFTHTEGSDRQDLLVDQNLDLGGRNFVGPKSFDNDFEMDTAAVIADFKVLDSNRLKLHLGPGLRYLDLSLDIETSQGDKLNADANTVGLMFGFRMIVPFTERLSGEVRLAASHAIMFNDDVYLADGSVELNYKLAKHFKAFGGWYSSNYENSEEFSQIDIDTQGLRYGLQLEF